MNRPSANLLVAVTDNTVCVRISGRATFACSLDLKKLIYEMLQRGSRHFVLDLTECALMDSTFLGMLAGIGLKFAEPSGRDRALKLLNPNPRICDTLENLGVAHLFQITRAPQMDNGVFETMDDRPEASKAELTRNSLEAHETLMQIHPDNVPKFKDVARFLAEDLKKTEQQ